MTQKAGNLNKLLLAFIAATLICIVTGCGQKSARLPTYMRPELLYLNEQPYSRLYVEVDTVEGVEVPKKWLDTLKEFLSTHCSKPDGIEIVRDKPIPFEDIKDMPIGPASILCLDGPDPNSNPQPAYLHVFFYAKDKIFKKTKENPHIYSFCPSAIFYNADYIKLRQKQWILHALPHEAGHILGLCKNKSHGDGVHCKNKDCLMRPGPEHLPSLGLLLFGNPLKADLCDECLRDLEAYKSETADPNLTFNGPLLIRKEDGYSVASLPYCEYIIPQFMDEKFEWRQLLITLKRVSEQKDFGKYWKEKEKFRLIGIFRPKNEDSSLSDKELLRESLSKATEDPNPDVSHFAKLELDKIKQKQDD
jgi:hypothetical protein